MAPKAQPAPDPFPPSSIHVALAIALIRTIPPGTSARDYIANLRDQVRAGSSPSEHQNHGDYLDLVAYWKEQCRRLQDECDHLRNENSRLERSNHSLAHSTACTPDMSPVNALQPSKRKARAVSPARCVKRMKIDQPVERSAAETQEEIDEDMEFLDGLGQAKEGMNLTESLFNTHKLCRITEPDVDILCCTLVRTSTALGKVIRLVAHKHKQLSRQDRQASTAASLDQDRSNFALAMTICARGFMSVLVGLTRLNDSSNDSRFSNLVVCALADMFKTVLIAIESVARETAQQALTKIDEYRRSKDVTKGIKESVPARALAHLLIGLLGFLEKTNPMHQQIFDGFVYLLLERVGQRLFYCTFGRHRASTIEGDLEPVLLPFSAEDVQKVELEALGIHLEVKALILVLERAMGLAPNHMNPHSSNISRNQRNQGRTLSLRTLPAASKARLSPVAKERLQRTLITCMYGDKAEDEFLDVLTKPLPSMRLGSLQNVATIEDKDVKEWYKKEVWRLVGWDVLAREVGWS
ncbi:hypothetical protein SVAN01_06828 [Stagonosporopsis vannaccii]|nr:hypothetical protein SVAN01_06828 [Stagonosporopsis vannaccii]